MVIKNINDNLDLSNNQIYYAGTLFKKKDILTNMYDKLFNNKKNLKKIKYFCDDSCNTNNNYLLLNKLTKYINNTYTEIGLVWNNIGTNKPDFGYEITNEKLKKAISINTTLTKTQLNQIKSELLKNFHINNIYLNSYIKVGNFYFQPSHKDELYNFILDFDKSYINNLNINTTEKKCKTLFNYINIYAYLILFWINNNFILPSFNLKTFNKINCIDKSIFFIFDNNKQNMIVFFDLLIYKFQNLWNNQEYIEYNKLLFERYFFIINSFLKFIIKNKYIHNIGNYDMNYFIDCFVNQNYNTFNHTNDCNYSEKEHKIYCIFQKNKYKLNYIISYLLTINSILQKLYLNNYIKNIKIKYNKLNVDNYIINSNFNELKYHITKMYPNTNCFKKFTNIVDLFNIIINSKETNNKNRNKINIINCTFYKDADSNTISRNDLATILTISILKYNHEIINNNLITRYNSQFDIIDSEIIYNTLINWDTYIKHIFDANIIINLDKYNANMNFFHDTDCNDIYKKNIDVYDIANIPNIHYYYDNQDYDKFVSPNISAIDREDQDNIRKWLAAQK